MAKSPLESGRRGRRLRIILIADRATRPCAEGRSYLTKLGLVFWENRPLALKTRNASILAGRQAGRQNPGSFSQAIDKRAGVNGGPRIVCRGERKGWEVEPTYHSH